MAVGHTADWEGSATADGYVELELEYAQDDRIKLIVKVLQGDSKERVARSMAIQWLAMTNEWLCINGSKITFPQTLDSTPFKGMSGIDNNGNSVPLPENQQKPLAHGFKCTRRDPSSLP